MRLDGWKCGVGLGEKESPVLRGNTGLGKRAGFARGLVDFDSSEFDAFDGVVGL